MTDKLFALNYDQQIWTVLPIFKDYNPPKNSLVSKLLFNIISLITLIIYIVAFQPRGRFLHSAITTDEYMFVFGGRTDPPSTNDTLIAYSYACNQWIRLLTPGKQTRNDLTCT